MSLYEKTNNRYKYKFHVEIEKGDFSIFESYPINTVMKQYRDANFNKLTSHTTLHSLLKYIEKSFTVKNENAAINEWKEIKNKYVDFNQKISTYGERYDFPKLYNAFERKEYSRTEIDFTNFISLLHYNFDKKFKKLGKEIFADALDSIDLNQVEPVYIIRTLKLKENQDFINIYLDKLVKDYPDKSLGNVVELLDVIENKDTYEYFLIKSLKERVLSSYFVSKTLNNFSGEQILNIIEEAEISFIEDNTSLPQEILNTLNEDKSELFFNYLKEKGYDFSNSGIRDYNTFISRKPENIKKLTYLGVKYNMCFEPYIFRSTHGIEVNTIGDLLIKNNLWDFNEKSDKGIYFIDYWTNKYEENIEQNSLQEIKYDFRNALENILKCMKKYTSINNIDFLKSGNEMLSIYGLNIILKTNVVSEEALKNYFNSESLPEGLINFIYSENSHEKAKVIFNPSTNIDYFSVTKEQFNNIIDKIEIKQKESKMNFDNSYKMLDFLVIKNQEKDYFKDENFVEKIFDLYISSLAKTMLGNTMIDYDEICNSIEILDSINYKSNNENINNNLIIIEKELKSNPNKYYSVYDDAKNMNRFDKVFLPLKAKIERKELEKVINKNEVSLKNKNRL